MSDASFTCWLPSPPCPIRSDAEDPRGDAYASPRPVIITTIDGMQVCVECVYAYHCVMTGDSEQPPTVTRESGFDR